MKSRLDKYDNKESFSRVNKNQNLYDDIYSNTNYSNMVVIDDSNEIDISKIKEIIDKQKNVNKRVDKTPNLEKEYDSIVPPKNYENKLYDINEVLKEAKSQRDIMEDANEKRKIQNYKFNENLDEELSKTRKVYESLVKEEKELLNIMNTLTNVSSVDLAKDMFNDLTVYSGLIWGKVQIDTIKEVVFISNLSKKSLDEIETSVTEYMMKEKKKYARREKEEK